MGTKSFTIPLILNQRNQPKIVDGADAKREEIKSVFKTNARERVYRPGLGHSIHRYLFLPIGRLRDIAIRGEIVRAIVDNVDDVVILSIDIQNDKERKSTTVDIFYQYNGINDSVRDLEFS